MAVIAIGGRGIDVQLMAVGLGEDDIVGAAQGGGSIGREVEPGMWVPVAVAVGMVDEQSDRMVAGILDPNLTPQLLCRRRSHGPEEQRRRRESNARKALENIKIHPRNPKHALLSMQILHPQHQGPRNHAKELIILQYYNHVIGIFAAFQLR
jgi:hypothetical protein